MVCVFTFFSYMLACLLSVFEASFFWELVFGVWVDDIMFCAFLIGADFYCPPSICWTECYIYKWKSTPGFPLV